MGQWFAKQSPLLARAKKSTSVTRSVTNPTPPPTPKDAEKNEQKSCAPKSEYTQEEKTAATDRKEKAEICADQHFDECKTQLSEFRIEVKPSKEEKSAKTPGKGSGKLRSNKSWNERLKAKFESSSKRFKMRKKEKEEHPANHLTKSPMSRRLKTLAARMGGSKKDSGLQKNKVESKISAKDEKKVAKGSRVSKKEKRQERAKIVVPESDMPIDL
ncbi:hypothetical protein RB195_016672 [Necator americanus]|uniref:Uncharacterized protein n=1 Tax=Necator americanus TaxID=51031 RepID=A0ABR1C445_NECAM